jgi:phosphopantothenate---cysteine ligase (CTP)
MKCLITAGNTQVLIDKVRCITNIFSGKTGTQIALELHGRGHEIVLLTSRPEVVDTLADAASLAARWQVYPYSTFEDLQQLMAEQVSQGKFDALIHSAAVSDYLAAGVYSPHFGTHFDPQSHQWHSNQTPRLRDVSAGKVKSSHDELWLRFTKAPKLVDMVRRDWGFAGKLIKFKLEVGISEQQLEQIAESSRIQSKADLMVANTLEGMKEWAIMGPIEGQYVKVERSALARMIVDWIEKALTPIPSPTSGEGRSSPNGSA